MEFDSVAGAVELVAHVLQLLERDEMVEREGLDRGQVRYAQALAHTLLDQLRTMQATAVPAAASSGVRLHTRPSAAPVSDETATVTAITA
jgi:hypothetical protein